MNKLFRVHFFSLCLFLLTSSLYAQSNQSGWEKLKRISDNEYPVALSFSSKDTGGVLTLKYTDSTYYFYTTTDGGASWNAVTSFRKTEQGKNAPDREVLGAIRESNGNYLFVLRERSSDMEGQKWKELLYSISGSQLTKVEIPLPNSLYYGDAKPPRMLPSGDILIPGDTSLMLLTSSNTLRTLRGTDATYGATYSMDFINTATGLATTDSGLLQTLDSGKTWQLLSTEHRGSTLYALQRRWLEHTGLGTVAITSDSGKTWNTITEPFNNLQGEVVTYGRTAILRSFDLTLYRTTDEGDTWSTLDVPSQAITPMQIVNDSTAFAILDLDVYRTVQLPSLEVLNTSVAKSELHFYPQPARTMLTVTLPQGKQVSAVTVLDALGRTLMEQHTQGSQAQLDCSQLPSGMYWIHAGSLVQKFVVAGR